MSTQDERSAAPLDRIRLTGVSATGYHGVLEHERVEGQPFVADVVAYLDTRRAAARDDLAHTLDYGTLATQVVAVLAGDPADLIETVAERIAATVLSHAVVQGVDVTVHKPQAPITVPFADVSVEIHRDRNKLPAAEPVLEEAAPAVPPARPAPARTASLPVVGAAAAGAVAVDALPVDALPADAAAPAGTTPAGFEPAPEVARPAVAPERVASAGVPVDATPAPAFDLPFPAPDEVDSLVPPAPGPVVSGVPLGSGRPVEAPVWAPIPGVSSAPDPVEPVVVGPAPVGALPTGVVPAVAAAAPVPAVAPAPPVSPVSPVVPATPVPSPPASPDGAEDLAGPVTPTPPTPTEPASLAEPAPGAPETPPAPAPAPASPAPDGARALVPADVVDGELVTDALDEAPAAPVDVVLALGSNLGPAQETLRQAVRDLAGTPGVQVVQVSPLARTAPVGGPEQPDFLNAVLLARTTLAPRALLRAAQTIEKNHRRERHERWGPRTLDIDIVVYGGVLAVTDDLELPHPRAHERAFVLQPWAEVDPHAVLPGLGGGPVAALAATAPDREGLRWLALDWLEGPAPAPTGEQPPAQDA